MKFSDQIRATDAPPVMEARRWLDERPLPADMPLINVSQAAPVDPPPDSLRAAMSRAVLMDASAHLYGPVLGLDTLRRELADRAGHHYGAPISQEQVAITSGCNQAFCAAISTLCDPGDNVLLPVPWYFNHKMWLDTCGVGAVPIATGDGLLPMVSDAEAQITERTRAIVLVTPNNPCGVEYPAELVAEFHDLARAHQLTLIVDETYRDFDSRTGAPHHLFSEPDWPGTFIHLYSFSKAYRLTGHRVGAMIAAPERLQQTEKFLDSIAICPSQIGQHGALYGLRNLGNWLASEREEILSRRAAIEMQFATLRSRGWTLLGLGAYFAYLRHPFPIPSNELAPLLLEKAGILCLPGTMFRPEGDAQGQQELRIAFANIDAIGIATLFSRLAALV